MHTIVVASEINAVYYHGEAYELHDLVVAALAKHRMVGINFSGVYIEVGCHESGMALLVDNYGPEVLRRVFLFTQGPGNEPPELQMIRKCMWSAVDWLAYWAGEYEGKMPWPENKRSLTR